MLKIPHSAGSEADIRAAFTLLEAVRDDTAAVADMVNGAEDIRRRVADLEKQPSAQGVNEAATALDRRFTAFEERLYQLRLTGGQDGMRWGGQLLQKLSHLAGGLQDSDFPPTAQEIAVREQFAAEIKTRKAEYDALMTGDLARFNGVLKAHGLPPLK